MIAIVIVSHSREVADGLKRMAEAMNTAPIPIVSAGGMDDAENPLGTDAVLIHEAILDVLNDDGVLVFADIGSAKLNAETAIDLLEDNQKDLVHFCEAPLVEGVLAAAVQVAVGETMDNVIREAQTAYIPVQIKTNAVVQIDKTCPHSKAAISHEYKILNPLGLHARPAARFVTAMNTFNSDVRIRNITNDSACVNAKSINKVMTIEVLQGNNISISSEGHDAKNVHIAVKKLIEKNFDEGSTISLTKKGRSKKSVTEKKTQQRKKGSNVDQGPILKGIAVSTGYAVAPAYCIKSEFEDVKKHEIIDVQKEIARFNQALEQAHNEIKELMKQNRNSVGEYEVRIFEAHLLHLEDPEISDTVRERIQDENINADYAWKKVVSEIVATYRTLDNVLMRARGDDLEDVGTRVLRILLGANVVTKFDEPVILCFNRIKPSDVIGLDGDMVQGICVGSGSKTSHAGILVSALGIPAVFGIGNRLLKVQNGTKIILDGKQGTLNIQPNDADIAEMNNKRDAWLVRLVQANKIKFDAAITRDGFQICVAANMAKIEEVENINQSGAEEVGLFRTEFMFMNRVTAPSEEEQFEVYRQIINQLEGRTLTIRTMDIGGDKPVSYLQRPNEANPNLGWRGLRYSLDNRELFQAQLKAILRASNEGPVRIMFPMVSTLDEVLAAQHEIEIAKQQLHEMNQAFVSDIEVGIMIEVPAAAELAEKLAEYVDFFSIGTNDLTQYIMASDRGNEKLAGLFDPFHPAVLRTIHRTIVAANDVGIWVGMCGAMAGDILATPVLLGLGLNEFSMNPSQIAEFKLESSKLSANKCVKLAHEVLALESASQVRSHVQEYLAH